jgi:integrase
VSDNRGYQPGGPAASEKGLARVENGARALVPVATLADDLRHAMVLSQDADSPNTRRAYRSDLADWKAYADQHGLVDFPMTVDVAAAYIASLDRRELRYATIRRRCSALSRLHKDKGERNPFDDPRIRAQFKGIGSRRGRAKRVKKPITGAIVRAVIEDASSSPMERAMLATGFVCGMRRSELTQILWSDVEELPLGIVITVQHSKTDQEGEGMVKGVPFAPKRRQKGIHCAASLLLAWRKVADTRGEPRVFPISDKTLARVVKKAAAAVGEDPAEFGGHSLRAGLATTSAEAGVDMAVWMKATGHKSADVAAGYVRSHSALTNLGHKAAVDSLSAPAASAKARATKLSGNRPSSAKKRPGKRRR